MKPLEFLAEVLPPPGNGAYCVAELSSRKKEHVFINSLEEAKPHIKAWLAKGRDIYFALSTFANASEGRKAHNSVQIKSLFIDMDGYESKKDAAMAMSGFLERTGLDRFGTPHLVASGGGLHCYWPLSQPVSTLEWKPVAEAFKRLCKQENLRIDMTVTADAARVLRVPGTMNFKTLPDGTWKYGEPKPVKVMLLGDACVDLRDFSAAVLGQLREEFAPLTSRSVNATMTLDGKRPTKKDEKQSAMMEALVSSSGTRFETIWMKSEKSVGCGQLEFYMDNAQQDGMEPLWRGLLSWAKVCEDGPAFAQKLSELHPYTHERTVQKLAEIKGPYPCVKMDEENPGICQKCPYWGKVTNALALGREIKVDNRAKTFAIPINALDKNAENDLEEEAAPDTADGEEDVPPTEDNRTRTSVRPPPPKGYDYADSVYGGVVARVREKDASGTVIDTQVMVLPYDLFVMDVLRNDAGDHIAHMMAIRHIGGADEAKQVEYTPILVPSRSVVSKDELLKHLAAHNIYAAHGAQNDGRLHAYVRACVEEAALAKRAVDVPLQFGWQRDRSFVYNNRVFRPDGAELIVPMPGLENLNRATVSKGTLEDWRKPWRLLQKRKLHTMLALCVDAFGSTLMHFSDYEGFTWHIGSTESGTGKSLTLSLKAGVWGHPIRYRTGKGTSLVAVQQRAGLLNSLPLLIDEVTGKTRNDVEWAPEFIFNMAEGQGKERMEAGANKERVNHSTWSATCTMTSNTHMMDVLTSSRKHSSHGEMMRLLEWTPTKSLEFDEFERGILKELRLNYGVAGEEWARWIVKNYATVKQVWNRTHERLRTEMRFKDDERYWHAACTSDIAAAILLGENYSGILPDLPIGALVEALLELVDSARNVQAQTTRTAEDVLNTFTREFFGKFVVIRKDRDHKLLAEMGADLTGKTSTRNSVMGRIEHGTVHPHFVEYYIEESVFKNHCASMSFGFADFQRKMEAASRSPKSNGFLATFGVKKDLLARTDGPSMRVRCMHFHIPMMSFDEGAVSLGET